MANAAEHGAAANEVVTGTTIDEAEVAQFSRLAETWWDPFGPFAPLHKFNPHRLALIRDELCQHFGRDRHARRPLDGLTVLDIGCGGGLVAEPMARMGAMVTGIDASARNVGTARAHAGGAGLAIDYRETTAEALAAEGARFDAVLTLEVVEHVADVDLFLSSAAAMVRPGGLLTLATINRTLRSLATAKIGAEYVLRWLPRGTHDWRKFLPPERVEGALEAAGLRVRRMAGLTYLPILDTWRVGEDLSVNYMVFAARPEGPDALDPSAAPGAPPNP